MPHRVPHEVEGLQVGILCDAKDGADRAKLERDGLRGAQSTLLDSDGTRGQQGAFDANKAAGVDERKV
jgi:hypothetical protein